VEEQACSCRYTPLKLKDNDFEVRKQQDINQQNLNYLTRGDNIMEVALHMSPEAGVTSTLMKQCGLKHAVSGISLQPIPGAGEEEQSWSYLSLMWAKTSYEKNGFEMSVIESHGEN